MMNNSFSNNLDFKRICNENDRNLRKLFKGQIKENFLIRIKYAIYEKLGLDIFEYYDFSFSQEKLLTNKVEVVDVDICRHIIGVHNTNLIFLNDAERVEKEKSSEYQEQLVNGVVENIRLRNYASVYFRRNAIIAGENFIYYKIPYTLFVLCIRMNRILWENNDESNKDTYYNIITSIVNKGMAALTLFEDNYFDNVYPICRGMIEIYVKLMILIDYPDAVERYEEFAKFAEESSFGQQQSSDKFNKYYESRKNQKDKNKINYLHNGWLDCIEDFHSKFKRKYTINDLISFLESKYEKENKIYFDNLIKLYKKCHPYIHGTYIVSKYPLIHYFEISIMLYYTLSKTYEILSEKINLEEKINNIDILGKLEDEFEQLNEQYKKYSIEKLEEYYRDLKI